MPRPITPRDLWTMARVGQPEPVPGTDVSVVPVDRYDVEEDRRTSRLYLVSANGEARTLTAGTGRDTLPRVSRDGTKVAFLRRTGADEPSRLHVMRFDGGEPEPAADLPLGVTDHRWLPDGSGLVLVARLFRDHPTIEATRQERDRRRDGKPAPVVTEDRVYRFWDRWLAGGEEDHLFHLDLATGELRDLAGGRGYWMDLDSPAGVIDVKPDGSEVAFAVETMEPPDQRVLGRIFTVSLDGGPVRQLTDDPPARELRPRYSPDGRTLVYGMQREWDFYADRVRLVRHDLTDGATVVLTEAWDRSAAGWEFVAADELVLTAEDQARTRLFRTGLDAGVPEPLPHEGSVHGTRPVVDAAGDRRIWCRHETISRPPEVAVLTADGIERVSHFNDALLAELDLGGVESFVIEGGDGEPVQSWLVYPPGDRDRPLPLVQYLHGGPHGLTADAWHWRWNLHVFAATGYAVAGVNFHGSASWGQEFAASILGAWGDLPGRDVLAVTDHLVDAGVADPDRLAVIGGSYGGYLAAWLTATTDRFTCAVVHAGVTELVGQWASDITQGRDRAIGGTVWDDPEAVHRWNPIDRSRGLATPTLVVHGERDYRVVVTQGLLLYGVLRAKGVAARLVYYPTEGHWILEPANSLHWYREVLGWLSRHLGDDVTEPTRDGD